MQVEEKSKKNTNCAVYTRVSSDSQVEVEFNSCESQEEKIKSFVDSQEGFSDDVLRKRIGQIKVSVQEMVDKLKKDLPEGVVWPMVDEKMAGTVSFGGKIFSDKEFLLRIEGGGDVVAGLIKETDKRMYENKGER